MQAVASGEVDLECGSTTNNTARQKEVAFSPIIFVSGTKLLVRRADRIRSYRDLRDKTVVVTAGTTNEQALRAFNEKQKLGIKLVTAKDHDESFKMLTAKQADAFATDDVLLYGWIARTKSEREYIVVGEYLSYDPYGIMFRRRTIRSSQRWSSARSASSPRAGSCDGSTGAGSSAACSAARTSRCR